MYSRYNININNTNKRLNILLLHGMELKKDWLSGIADVELMFSKYDNQNNYLVHSCFYMLPLFLKKIPFDAVILTSTFMDKFVGNFNANNRLWIAQYDFLKETYFPKIVFAQDDYWYSEVRDYFYVSYGINLVHLVCPQESWDELVPQFIAKGGKTKQGYTTYVTPYIKSLSNFKKDWANKKFDLVYKATKNPKVPNHIGEVKGLIGDIFLRNITVEDLKNFNLDLSNQGKLLTGENWYRYLTNSRAMLGSNSGSSVLLRNKKMRNKLLDYKKKYPQKKAIEIEQRILDKCERGKDFTAISPRNLEAAALGILQVLVEGSYSDMLYPGRDFLMLKEDGNNAKEILNSLRDSEKCKQIIIDSKNSLLCNEKLNSEVIISDTIAFVKSFQQNDTQINFHELQKKYRKALSSNLLQEI